MNAAAKELRAQIEKVELQLELAEQAKAEFEEEQIEKVGALIVELARQQVSARQRKIPPVLEDAIRAGKLFPSQRAMFEAHLMAVPFEKFDAELEKVRVSFEERPQVIELGMEYGDGCEQFVGPGSGGNGPRTREELDEELRTTTRAHAQMVGSSGIQDPVAESIVQESEGGE